MSDPETRSCNVKLYKIIRLHDNNITIRLKDDIDGTIYPIKDQLWFICSHPKFKCRITTDHISKPNIKKDIENFIFESYSRYIKNKGDASEEDSNIYNFIDYVKNNEALHSNDCKKVFIIAYSDDYLKSIESTTSGLTDNVVCEHVMLRKNIDLNIGEDYDRVLSSLIYKINKSKCDYYIIDVSNLYLADYSMSKHIINYIEKEKNGKILFLVADRSEHCCEERFVKIYGEKYRNVSVDRMEYIYGRQKHLLEQSRNILFTE